MIKRVDRVGAVLLSAALCVLGAIILKFQHDDMRETELRQQAEKYQEVLDTARATLSSLKDVETGQRGYLITGRPRYLNPYKTGLGSLRHELGRLSELTRDQPDASIIASNLSAAVDAKLDELKATIAFRSAGDYDSALQRVLHGEGLSYMESARVLTEELITIEKRRLTDLQASIQRFRVVGHRIVLVACGFLFLLVTAGTVLLANEAAREKALKASLEESERRYRDLAANLEEQVQARTVELTALNKELEAFSYSVSHDLRAPLRSIDGFSLIILEDYADKLDPTGRSLLERIRAATGRMGQLIKSLLELSRVNRTEIHREPISLSSVAETVLNGLRAQDPGRVVETNVQDGLTVEADPGLSYVVLENLLSNAWKFTGTQSPARIEVTGELRNEKLTFCVSDNGTGFDPAFAERLYTPFQRLHPASQFDGIGIGLATVKRVVHRHGGEIWAESHPGQGAKFYFTLS